MPHIEILLTAAKKGDDDAFLELMQLHKEQLYRIAISYLKNEQNALDAIQETVYRAYRSLSRVKEPKFFNTWLVRILLNYCANEHQRNRRAASSAYETQDIREDDLIIASDRIVLSEAINHLDAPYRQVILLKYYEDMTITEVARVMERPEGTVKTWLNKALRMLRSHMGKELL